MGLAEQRRHIGGGVALEGAVQPVIDLAEQRQGHPVPRQQRRRGFRVQAPLQVPGGDAQRAFRRRPGDPPAELDLAEGGQRGHGGIMRVPLRRQGAQLGHLAGTDRRQRRPGGGERADERRGGDVRHGWPSRRRP
ncbi:hypothetical protein [Teichococcus vastitatis]|uniref:Uncharacterized protein n=1 Tax=Teichococcus vastitatis TaxID=2307076 RepID=A0ABS9W569_9PROT|nr:hypothetical protein [Pseudoroseomonas vastitatis]MCI0754437.1 hypothetical protein [Pseudoroseomonas vastitatis]